MKRRQIMLKSVTLATLLMMSSGQAFADTLTVTVTGLKVKGALKIALYDSETGYKTNKAVKAHKLNVTNSTAQIEFSVPSGTYAIKSYHDLNNNDKLDFNPLGIPAEPYAFSNKAKAMGQPSFKAAAFKINGDTAHTLAY